MVAKIFTLFRCCNSFAVVNAISRNSSILNNKIARTFSSVTVTDKKIRPCYSAPTCVALRFKSKWNTFDIPESPVDWLPFPWEKRPKFDIFENSGDLVKTVELDKSKPKPDFENSEELKTADDYVKYMFSLEQATYRDKFLAYKNELVKKVQQHPMDFDSLEVKAAIQTAIVRTLFDQRERKKRHVGTRVKLLWAINKRNQLLKILHRVDRERFNWLLEQLQINYKPPPVGYVPLKYTKDNELRRLTKEYCNSMKSEKMAAFHEELKSQQQAFLKQKEETLAWIAKEEETYGIKPSDYEKL